MSLKSYSVLKGRAKAKLASRHGHPHYHLWLDANGIDYRVAINVRSMLQPSEMEYLLKFRFHHPITERLADLLQGLHPVESHSDGLALDFIRLNLFAGEQMRTLPCDGTDLNDILDDVFHEAIIDPFCRVYVFGEPWAAEATDQVFQFYPSRGMHEVHMNQGNDPCHWAQDGVWQDGAILIEHPEERRWTGLFLKFQSQTWHTDDVTGHQLIDIDRDDGQSLVCLRRNGTPRMDGVVRIEAATVGLAHESVTLHNICPIPMRITGWSIADSAKRRWRLSGTLAPGEIREIQIGAPVSLGDHEGIITLLDRDGLKIHGVSYENRQVDGNGGRVAF